MSFTQPRFANLKSKGFVILAVILTLLFVSVYYPKILYHPDKYVLNDKGDAIKNYYCYAWHVQNDSSYLHYNGTNYPFGELHTYTDGNTLLANFIRFFSFLKPYSIPIFNLSLVFSFVLCTLFLFKIFRHYGVSDLFALISSVGITILCPQAFRISGHFTLSYSFVIPLTIYLLLKYEKKENKLQLTLWIGFILALIFLVHPYLGMMCSAFVLLYWISNFILGHKSIRKDFLQFSVQSIIPALLYLLFIKITDNHPERSNNPYGFLYFTSNIESVFISTHPPFRHMLSQIYKIKIQNWEGVAYVGITSLIVIIYLPFFIIKNRKYLITVLKEKPALKTQIPMMISSFILLLFSMGYPFKWGMEGALDYAPIIKQFRAPGRFAWVFFFTTTIFSTLVISRHFFANKNKVLRTSVCTALLLLFCIEGLPFHTSLKKTLVVKNPFNIDYTDKELKRIITQLPSNKYQAIIPLPYFHNGSDLYNFRGSEQIIRSSFIISYHTQIPLLANLTPRSSVSESIEMIQILASDLLHKPLKDKTRSIPFLILATKEQLEEEETALLNKGKLLFETGNFMLREISPNYLFVNQSGEKLTYFNLNKNKMINRGDYFLSDSSSIITLDFEQTANKAYTGETNATNMLYGIQPHSLEKDKEYEISFWYYNDGKKVDLNNVLHVVQLVNNDSVFIAKRNINTMPTFQDDKVVAKLIFRASNPQHKYFVFLRGGDAATKGSFKLDNFLIRRKETDVFKVVPGKDKDSLIILNNIILQ